MAHNPETTVRKIFTLPKALWNKVDDFRFENRIKTEAEAMRILLLRGLTTGDVKELETMSRELRDMISSMPDTPSDKEVESVNQKAEMIAEMAKRLKETAESSMGVTLEDEADTISRPER